MLFLSHYCYTLATVVVLVVLDVFSKILAQKFLYMSSYHIFYDVGFKYTENTGSAFSIPVPMEFTRGLGIVVIIIMGILWKKADSQSMKWGYIIALSGIIGNTFDRFYHGYVVDFIQVSVFPIFNIADICIFIGMAWLVFCELSKKNKTPIAPQS